MSSNVDYISKPNKAFIKFVAANIVDQYDKNPGLSLNDILQILNITFKANARSLASSSHALSDSLPHGSSLSKHNLKRNEREESFGKSRSNRRDEDDVSVFSFHDRRSSKSRRDEDEASVLSFSDRRSSRGKRGDTPKRERSVSRDRRASTPKREREEREDRRERRASTPKRERSVSRSRSDSDKLEKPQKSVTQEDGYKLFYHENVNNIKSQVEGLTGAKLPAEMARRWDLLSAKRREEFASRERQMIEEGTATFIKSKEVKKDDLTGARLYISEHFEQTKEELNLDSKATKIELEKRWDALSSDEKKSYIDRQNQIDKEVVSKITSFATSGEWPEFNISNLKLIQNLMYLRPGSFYVDRFELSSDLNSFTLKFYTTELQVIVNYDSITHSATVSINRNRETMSGTLDSVIQALISKTKIDIRNFGKLSGKGDGKKKWIVFLTTDVSAKYGYTKITSTPELSAGFVIPKSPFAAPPVEQRNEFTPVASASPAPTPLTGFGSAPLPTGFGSAPTPSTTSFNPNGGVF